MSMFDYITIFLCRRSMKQSNIYARQLYKNGIDKIHKELDVRHITKELRAMKFISNILLKKYQREMLPYFKAHLLTNNEKTPAEEVSEKIEFNLKTLISNSHQSKLDRRILKQIEISYENDDEEFKIDNTNKKFLK